MLGLNSDSLEVFVGKIFQISGLIKWLRKMVANNLPNVKLNSTEGNARKVTVNFAFCSHADIIKYRKTLTFSLQRLQITNLKRSPSFKLLEAIFYGGLTDV